LNGLRVRRIRLVGVLRAYDVSFLDLRGDVRPLSIVAGEISTGKTSILEFISYCLGGSDFPRHAEVRQAVNTALLEIELNGVPFVIERTCVERPSGTALVHSCVLEQLQSAHTTLELVISQPSAENSLSQFLLRQLGLADVQLREAPTQSASGVDRLSFRDLLKFVYVKHSQLGGNNLLLEHQAPVVRLKHEQVIDLMFDAHDNRSASIASEVKGLQQEIQKRQSELDSIERFLTEQSVPDAASINALLETLETLLGDSALLLDDLDSRMDAVSSFGDEQRRAHQVAAKSASEAADARRNALTQIERLTALAAQYDQDVKKLTFAKEASRLFDPLLLAVCPWCQQQVAVSDVPVDHCPVCRETLVDELAVAGQEFNIDKELRAVKQRQKELANLLDEIHEQSRESEADFHRATIEAQTRQRALDVAMRGRFAPFLDQRDQLVASIAQATHERIQNVQLLGMHEGADRRRREIGALRQALAERQTAQASAEETHLTRGDAVREISASFDSLLQEFRFPKLNDAHVDKRYVPHVRGLSYDKLGSVGAGTLVALAWYLSIFEQSLARQGFHPGVLMLDSPQQGLKPRPEQVTDEFQSLSIAESVYNHLIQWSQSNGALGQIIVVDNDPQSIADEYIIVRYTGSPIEPPYGLIDDATA
jgi:Zn-finger nucleic acid-binding protein